MKSTGMVGINEGAISYDLSPFGGVKESGIGREVRVTTLQLSLAHFNVICYSGRELRLGRVSRDEVHLHATRQQID